ncbi:MAG TPA: hemolysin family protein [Candidatus Acidoferrales bacterium]|nr:hemolysin family protein [Candidatus Acidoferrales bacterium]
MDLGILIPAILIICAVLTVVSYVDRMYLQLSRVTTGALRDNLDIFEAEIEPRLKLERQPATLTFRLLSHLLLVVVAALTILVAARSADTVFETALQEMLLPVCEVFFLMHLIPYLLLTHSTGRWLRPLVPLLRVLSYIVWPIRTLLEAGVSVAHLHDEKPTPAEAVQESIEALVEAGESQGILEPHDAELIEQVVEFGDKRVREVMTPRPDIIAIPAGATLAQLRQLLIDSKYSRVPVYENSLDEIIGIANVHDLLGIPEREAATRQVRELARPVIFVPETKHGSELLRELQQKKQQMAVAIDEYGNVAGLVTAEDLVEEIVGEIEDENRRAIPDAVREPDGSMVFRGSVPVERLEELLGVPIEREPDASSTTAAGLLNELAGHVPLPGESVLTPHVRFEVVDANQRKVLRFRARLLAPPEQPSSAPLPGGEAKPANPPEGQHPPRDRSARASRTAK